jgi:hypothetical protein
MYICNLPVTTGTGTLCIPASWNIEAPLPIRDRAVDPTQCFGSGSAWIRIQLVARIRIRIRNADPDPGGLKRAKMKKNRSKKPDNWS